MARVAPMSTVHRTLLVTPPGFASREAARFLWQMDEQRRALHEQTRGLTPEALRWQPAPGMNSMGMLLAHIAFAETHLVQVGVKGETTGHAHDVVGITEAEEGMPLAPGAEPPAALSGRPLEFFDDLLARARTHTRETLVTLTDADLERLIRRPPRPDGTVREFNVAWVLYHLIEHESGHRAQIALLRHLWELRAASR